MEMAVRQVAYTPARGRGLEAAVLVLAGGRARGARDPVRIADRLVDAVAADVCVLVGDLRTPPPGARPRAGSCGTRACGTARVAGTPGERSPGGLPPPDPGR